MRISDWSSDLCSSDLPDMAETPSGHHVDGGFDLSSLVSEPAPSASQETIPNARASKRSFKDWCTGKPKEKKAKVRRPTPPMPRKGLAGPLTNMYTGLGMTVSMIDKQCGMAIVERDRKSTRLNSSH